MIHFYLKRIKRHGAYCYIISQSYPDAGVLKSRDLMELGPDPSIYIEYFGRNGFAFRSVIEESLQKAGAEFSSDEIERLFKPFFKPEVRRIIETFDRSRDSRPRLSCDLEALVPGHRNVHIFDARRLYYLRFGRIDSGELKLRRWKFLDIFLCKSRDEIESGIDTMEQALRPREYASYVYASLGLQLLFPRYLRDFPSAIDREKLDRLVILELCKINSDEDFFLGAQRERGLLHRYLRKYAWFYFDFQFVDETAFEGFRFAAGTREAALPRPVRPIQEAYRTFGVSAEQFSRMSRRELKSMFRRKAKNIHPDRGGEHEDFLRLTEAYEQLKAIKEKTKKPK